MTIVSITKMNVSKNRSTLAVSVPINLSIKLDFVSVNGARETYFVYTVEMGRKKHSSYFKTVSRLKLFRKKAAT